MSKLKSPYNRWNTLEGKEQVDFYDLINLLESTGGSIPVEIAHALKKIMYVGQRGHKALVQDMREAVWSIERFLENIGTDDEEESGWEEGMSRNVDKVCTKLVLTPTESAFKLIEGSSYTSGYTRSGDEVWVEGTPVGGKYNVILIDRLSDFNSSLCKVDPTTFRVNTATDIDSPHDLMYNQLPTFTAEGE